MGINVLFQAVVRSRPSLGWAGRGWDVKTHAELAFSCLCCTHFYETGLWWSAQIVICDEKHAEDFSSLSELSSKSVFRHLNHIQYESACPKCMRACREINLRCWLNSQDTACLAVLVLNAWQRPEPLPTHGAQCGFHAEVGWGVEVQVWPWSNCSPAGRRKC